MEAWSSSSSAQGDTHGRDDVGVGDGSEADGQGRGARMGVPPPGGAMEEPPVNCKSGQTWAVAGGGCEVRWEE